MPRAQAVEELPDEYEAVETAAPGKRRRASGPRKEKPIYVLFRVADAEGNPVPKAQVQLVLATKNTDQVVELQDKEKDLTMVKVELTKE